MSDDADFLAERFCLTPLGSKLITDPDGGFENVRLQLLTGLFPGPARLGGVEAGRFQDSIVH